MGGLDDPFLEGDPFDDPLWKQAELMAGAPPRPINGGYGTYSLVWLSKVLPVIRTPDQLAVALLLYRQCIRWRSTTVDLPNGDLKVLGISRQTKYRTLVLLKEAGAVTVARREGRDGQSLQVTLHWFP
jgi:DNA-binding transcriptional ArsR family regulator